MTTAAARVISTVAKADRERAVATIVTAFSGDAVMRWVLPEPRQYLEYAPELVRRFCGKAFEDSSAFAVEKVSASKPAARSRRLMARRTEGSSSTRKTLPSGWSVLSFGF